MSMPSPTKLVPTGNHYSDGTPVLITMRLRGFLATVGIPESSIAQGCKHEGSLSATTHNGLEVFDGPYYGDDHTMLRRIKDAGGCGWPRDERDSAAYGGSNKHTHVVVPNGRRVNRLIDPLAMSQVRSYWLGRNGLADNGLDRYRYRPEGHPIFSYKKWWINEMQDHMEQSAERRIRAAVHNRGRLWHELVKYVIRFQNHVPKKNH